jgi:hypothetical protein
MVETRYDRVDDTLEDGEIDHPSGEGIGLSPDSDLAPERVTMNPPALMLFGRGREIMRRLETEVLHQLERSLKHDGKILLPGRWRRAFLLLNGKVCR